MKNKLKKIDLLTVIPFLMFIFTFGLLYFFTPDIEFSENENKYLEQMPEITVKSIVSGDFERDFETYLSEQIPGRDLWVTTNTMLQLLSGKKDVNGVYVGSDGYLLEIFDRIDMVKYENQIAALNRFSSYVNVPVYCVIAPNSVSVHGDKLPSMATNYSQDTYISQFYAGLAPSVTTIDVSGALYANSHEYVYYRTDHHWTTYGAFVAYNEIAEVMGLTSYEEEEVTFTPVSEDFLGTFFSKGNFPVEPDTVYRCDIKNPVPYTVTLDDGSTRGTLYDDSYLEKKDKYCYFSHGNPAHLTVNTESSSGRTLVLIKDSYAHCMLPFFTADYSVIHMIDPRYVKTNLTDYIIALSPDDILVLYNAKTLSDDVNFTRLGGAPKGE